MIRNVGIQDAQDIVDIYNNYIRNTTITFETEPLQADAMEKRISDISALYPFLAYEMNGIIVMCINGKNVLRIRAWWNCPFIYRRNVSGKASERN